jgi:sarcosine oxidase
VPAHDVAVVGLGIIGSAALAMLARRGVRAVGIERFAPAHDRGSSHGATRVIRLGYFEHPAYVPLLRRAYEGWRDLGAAARADLMRITGIVEIGPPDGVVVPGTLAAARAHDLPHEVLDARATMRRFPAFRLPAEYVAVVQPEGGYLLAEPAVRALMALARAAGAEVRSGETVRAIEPRAGGVCIVTDRADIMAASAVVAAGPWLPTLVPQLAPQLRVTRQVLGWFKPLDAAAFAPGRFPVFLMETRHGIHYGFPPDADGLVKVAKHHHADETVDPDGYDRAVTAQDEALIRAALAEHLPAADGPLAAAKTCLYTMTPDGDFVIDRLPGAPHIIVASPCSGHGFKFAPVIGEILADLATAGRTRHDISRFRLARFA